MSRRTRLIIFITLSAVFILAGWAIIQGVQYLLITAAFTVIGAIVGLLQILFPMPLLTTLTSRSSRSAETKQTMSSASRDSALTAIKHSTFIRKNSGNLSGAIGIWFIVFAIFDMFIPGALLNETFHLPWFIVIYPLVFYALMYTYDAYLQTAEEIRRKRRRGVYNVSAVDHARSKLPFVCTVSFTILGPLCVGWHYGPSVISFIHYWYLSNIIGALGMVPLISPVNLYIIYQVESIFDPKPVPTGYATRNKQTIRETRGMPF
jgi:hypothetical protein